MADEKIENSDPLMRPCNVCGRWMALSKESQRVYCCEDCSQTYDTCKICGKFYLKDSGPEPGICSMDCQNERSSYFPLFKELDE